MEIRNKRTFDYLNQFIKEDDKILDVGCRDGELREYLHDKKSIHYIGIDPGLDSEIEHKEKWFFNSTIEDFKTDLKFDIIVMSHVLEHTQSPYLALKKAQSFLKPSGKILMSVPNIYTFKFLQVIPFNIKGYPKGNIGHYQEFTKMEIENLCRDLKLKIDKYQPRGFECVLIQLPWCIQKFFSCLFPWMSTELNFILKNK